MPQSMSETGHQPVLLKEMLEAVSPRDGGIYIDGTFGGGGYTRAVLKAARCRVLAIDRDPRAVAEGTHLEAQFPEHLTIVSGLFSNLQALAKEQGIGAVDGVMLDVGVSSMQLDSPERGFSFQKDGPLDMRMGSEGRTAAQAVNTLPEKMLETIIAVFGEERRARAIAHAIIVARARKLFTRTGELEKLVVSVLGGPAHHTIHPATRTFQALRIYVNAELEELVRGLQAAEEMLKPGGRLAVVTFHSLEDRIVKRFLSERGRPAPRPSRHAPPVGKDHLLSFSLLAPSPVLASAEEIGRNPRARSAKLRAAVRTVHPAMPLTADLLSLATLEGRNR